MSWPQDGKPRFVVVETVGHLRIGVGSRPAHLKNASASRTVAVLDRAWAYRTVYRARSEDFRSVSREVAVARAQSRAAERCAELNAMSVVLESTLDDGRRPRPA